MLENKTGYSYLKSLYKKSGFFIFRSIIQRLRLIKNKKGVRLMGDKNPNKLKKKKKVVEKVTVQPIIATETASAKKPKK